MKLDIEKHNKLIRNEPLKFNGMRDSDYDFSSESDNEQYGHIHKYNEKIDLTKMDENGNIKKEKLYHLNGNNKKKNGGNNKNKNKRIDQQKISKFLITKYQNNKTNPLCNWIVD